jgi:hypothetical protein
MSNVFTQPSQPEPQTSSRQNYGEKYQDHFLEQYKLYIEMMDRTSNRRNQMNGFYTSLLSALLALITIATNKDISQFKDVKFQAVAFLAVAILGILLCIIWYINIQSYKQLNSGKFKVISELEKQLPFACYDREWELLKKDTRYKGYLTQTSVEKVVPFILAIPYIGLFIYSLLSFK